MSKLQSNTVAIFVLLIFFICVSCKKNAADPGEDNEPGIIPVSQVVGLPVIYETDMTLDVDDVGGLAVLHGLQTEGKVTILGVSYNEIHPLARFAIDAINTYYHRGNIPIGVYDKALADPDGSDYFTYDDGNDVDNMPHDLKDNIITSSLDLYKQILASQEDSSVIVISVGFLNNLYDLLNDADGFALVAKKVKLLAVMGGLHNDGFNFVRHNLVGQTQYVIEHWPGALVVTDAGGNIITGETLTSTTPENNPVRRAFELEWGVGPNNGRSSWDEITTLYAVFGTKYFVEYWNGGGSLNNGYTWSFKEGYRGYAEPKNNSQVEREIERLMTLPPN